MGKLPYLQFYLADWLTDNIAGCSLAAQGLWLRMMIVMHSAERRGYLVMNGRAMTDGFIASKCGCDVAAYRSLLDELSDAGVPRKTSDGIIFNKRMVEDEKERADGRKRKQVERERKNGNVTPIVTRLSSHIEDEDVNEVETENERPEENFNGEMWVNAILSAHPKPEWGQAAQSYVIDAITAEAKSRKWNEKQAAEYIQARTQLFAQYVARWPDSEKKFVKNGTDFFEKRIYNQPESAWERGDGQKNRAREIQQQNRSAIRGAVAKSLGVDADRQGFGEIPEPNNRRGNGGYLPGRLDAIGAALRAESLRGGAGGVRNKTGTDVSADPRGTGGSVRGSAAEIPAGTKTVPTTDK